MQIGVLVDVEGEQVLNLIENVKKEQGTLIYVNVICVIFKFLPERLVFSLLRS